MNYPQDLPVCVMRTPLGSSDVEIVSIDNDAIWPVKVWMPTTGMFGVCWPHELRPLTTAAEDLLKQVTRAQHFLSPRDTAIYNVP